jgi:hypothetical protein
MTLDELKAIELRARSSSNDAQVHANKADRVAMYRATGDKAEKTLAQTRADLLAYEGDSSPLVLAYRNAEAQLREEFLAIVEADLRGKARVLGLQARAAWLELGYYVEPQEPKA